MARRDEDTQGAQQADRPPLRRRGLRVRASYVWALLFTAALAGWMLSGDVIIGGRANSGASEAPTEATSPAASERRFRVRTRIFVAEARAGSLVVRGRTEAGARVEVKAETAARVEALPAAKGAKVEAGSLLCRLDAGARLAAVHEAEAALAQAQAEYEASQSLAERGHGAALKVAADKARVDAARAALERSRLELARTQIKAPFAGIVESQPAKVGAYLAVGATCATLVDLDPLLVTGSVSEREVGLVRPGMRGTATLITGETAEGTIRYVAPAADQATRTFAVELEIANADGRLRDGITADIELPLPPKKAHKLPAALLVLDDAGRIGVRAVMDGDTVRFLPVEVIGDSDSGLWVAGLPDSVRIITVGQHYVVDGQKVDAVDQTGMAAR